MRWEGKGKAWPKGALMVQSHHPGTGDLLWALHSAKAFHVLPGLSDSKAFLFSTSEWNSLEPRRGLRCACLFKPNS